MHLPRMTFQFPIATFRPVSNARQQIVALFPDFGNAAQFQIIQTLQGMQESGWFDQLAGLKLIVPVGDIAEIPADLGQRLPASKLHLLFDEQQCLQADHQARLRHLRSEGLSFMVMPSDAQAEWDGAQNLCYSLQEVLPTGARIRVSGLHRGIHLASGIADSAVFEQMKACGFQWFEGSYPYVPVSVQSQADQSARTRLLKLLGLVARDADTRELEELFRQDPNLSFLLFKLVSSAAFAQMTKVSSLNQAIALIGRRQLQRWLQLLLYASQANQPGSLHPLMPRAAFRAAMMEALVLRSGGSRDAGDSAFMTGMFSLLDVLFGTELEKVLTPLHLEDDVLNALMHREGLLGECLQIAAHADRRWNPQIAQLLQQRELDSTAYYESVQSAFQWVNQVCKEL
ncbi:hypothetical protein GCM10010946_02310 [Undibacterium squillarum]|uniref:HDOD domain-containing protein n=2 Tax=Undibacterium squillarum TaxID=1131567 RepID=A0ABQ2XQC6_9BURK|nr:hypothetical protein GCM10010946_02310 [Undibacterium squillarum]